MPGSADLRESLAEMQRGVAISNVLGALISLLVIIVGALASHDDDTDTASVAFVVSVLETKEGSASRYIFCIAYTVASVSAALTTFLGGAISVHSLLGPMTEPLALSDGGGAVEPLSPPPPGHAGPPTPCQSFSSASAALALTLAFFISISSFPGVTLPLPLPVKFFNFRHWVMERPFFLQ